MMLQKRTIKITYEKILITSVLISSIIPDIGIKFSTFGFTWTTGRIMLALTLLGTVIMGKSITLNIKTYLHRWMLFMFFWVIYGMIFLFISKYTDRHKGIVECLSLLNGLIIIYILGQVLDKKDNRDYAINLIYWLLNLLLIMAVIEIVTGKHWYTSAFYDSSSSISMLVDKHVATGLMYNMNDFSALITCLSPVLLCKRFSWKRIVTLIGILIINLINDASVCTLGIIIFGLYYFLIIRGGKSRNAIVLKTVFWIISISFFFFLLSLGTKLTNRNDWIGAIARQIFNARQGFGSLFARIIIYKDTVKAWILTGLLGMGPSSFTNYFTIHQSLSKLVNPHAFFLEILSEYGIVVFLWFVFLLIKMFITAQKAYGSLHSKQQKEASLMAIGFIIIYCFASFAPSSFVGYIYQWAMIAVMCSQLDHLKEGGLYSCLNLR